mmetsp:Transcript_45307/g.71042  ORF Transcript_45307/g.71042 Transcript_45307/m.71042 type:complete len:235 (+) Transcript_45307:364-1068(+)
MATGLMRSLTSKFAHDDGKDWDKARDAAAKGDLQMLEAIIKRNPEAVFCLDGKSKGMNAAHRAAASGQLEALKLLHSKNRIVLQIKDEKRGWFAAHWAAQEGQNDVVAWIGQVCAHSLSMPDSRGQTPWHLLLLHKAKQGDWRGIRAIAGLYPETLDAIDYEFGAECSAAHLAAKHGHKRTLALLLNMKPEFVHCKDCMDRSVKDYAVEKGLGCVLSNFVSADDEVEQLPGLGI